MPPSIDPTAASRQALRANSRRELAGLTFDHLQQREDHWAIVDLMGEAGHISRKIAFDF
jgi:hypothetical protein